MLVIPKPTGVQQLVLLATPCSPSESLIEIKEMLESCTGNHDAVRHFYDLVRLLNKQTIPRFEPTKPRFQSHLERCKSLIVRFTNFVWNPIGYLGFSKAIGLLLITMATMVCYMSWYWRLTSQHGLDKKVAYHGFNFLRGGGRCCNEQVMRLNSSREGMPWLDFLAIHSNAPAEVWLIWLFSR